MAQALGRQGHQQEFRKQQPIYGVTEMPIKIAGEERPGVFLVTGGGRGIGAATARLAAGRGYRVAVFYRSNAQAANQLAKEIGGLAVQADVGDERSLMHGFEAVDRLGKLEVLVNNA